MMRKTNLISAAVVAMLALTTIPAGQSDLLVRSFPDIGVEAEFPPGQDGDNDGSGGVGLVDPDDPDNTCLALLFLSVGSPLLFYYSYLRVLPVGVTVDDEANANVGLSGTPADDCFDLASPGSDLVVDRFRDHAGGQVHFLNLLDFNGIAILSTIELGYALCDAEEAATTNTAAPLSARAVVCDGVINTVFTPVDEDATNPGWDTFMGMLDRRAPLFLTELTHGSGSDLPSLQVEDAGATLRTTVDRHKVVEFCLRVQVFDTSFGVITSESDRDHVVAVTANGFRGLVNTAGVLEFVLDPNNLSDLVTTAC